MNLDESAYTERMSRKERIRYLFEQQNGRCYYCLALLLNWHVDHLIPRSRGGPSTLDNIRLACPSCNLRKHTKSIKEFCG